MGSIAETQSHLIFCGRIGLIDESEVKKWEEDYDELVMMLRRFIDYIFSDAKELGIDLNMNYV